MRISDLSSDLCSSDLKALADAGRPQALLAVPLHRARLRTRGYDQALDLARPLARALGIPLLPGALVRRRATSPQSDLNAALRSRNLRAAVSAPTDPPRPAHVAPAATLLTPRRVAHPPHNPTPPHRR